MKHIFSIYLLILFPLIAFSQTEKQLVPSDLKQQTIVTEPVTLRKGFFRAGVDMSYGVANKYFTNEGKREYLPTSTWGTKSGIHLTLQYGISNRLQADLSLGYVNTLYQSQNEVFVPSADTTAEYSFTLRGRGIGDSYALIRYQILPEGDKKSSLTARVFITFPTGEKNPTNIKSALVYDPAVGIGNFATELNLTFRKIVYPYSYTGYMGYEYNFSGTKLMNATDSKEKEFKDGDILRFGGSFNLHLNEWIALTNDISYLHIGKNKVENAIPEGTMSLWNIFYETHLVFQIKQFRLAEAIIIPLKGKNGASADPQYVVIAQYLF